MKFFYIRDDANSSIWSRNRWGSPLATPDLYKKRAHAQKQIDSGKISCIARHLYSGSKPVIVEARLTPFP